jgi:hypothetical protein
MNIRAAKMDTAGPSSFENPNWEDELDACSDSDASWGDEDDSDRESIASSLGSNDDAFINDPETVEVELQLAQMFIRIAEWKEQLEERQRRPIPQRTSELTGPMWIYWVLTNPNPRTCYERFRMWPDTYLALCNTLKQNGFLQSSRYVKITEQVAVFCLIMSHNWSQRDVSDRLQRSLHTVSVYCKRTCKAICRLGKTIIQPTQTMKPHPVVARNGNFYPWFTVSNALSFFSKSRKYSFELVLLNIALY